MVRFRYAGSPRLLFTLTVLGCALSPPSPAQQARPPGGLRTANGVVFLQFPELIAAPRVHHISFSPDGRYALLERSKGKAPSGTLKGPNDLQLAPASETTLIYWDSRTRSAREVWSGPSETSYVEQIEWIPGSGVALVRVLELSPLQHQNPPDEPEEAHDIESQMLLQISPAGEARQVMRTEKGDSDVELSASPLMPLAVFVGREAPPAENSPATGASVGTDAETARDPQTLLLIDASGRIIARKPLSDTFLPGLIFWDSMGRPLIQGIELYRDRKPEQITYAVDPRTAALSVPATEPALYQAKTLAEPPPSPLRVRYSTATVKEGETVQNLGMLWLEDAAGVAGSRALVCADCTEGRLLPGGDVIVYQSQEAVWAVPLMKMSRETGEELRRQAQKRAALNNARRIAEDLKTYASDNDENYPVPGDLAKILSRYSDPDPAVLLRGFTYTFNGGKLPENTPPSGVELGYVRGGKGRAIMYADDHVIWKED